MHGATGAITLLTDAAALARTDPDAITALVERSTRSTYYRDGMTAEQHGAVARIVTISAECCARAAGADAQLYIAAFDGDMLAGFVIATRHAPDNLELDWMMVGPDHQGRGIAGLLMNAGLDWLGRDKPIWLNVVAHNGRAQAFYRRFGFAVDPETPLDRVVPQVIMRRPADMA